MICSNVHQKIRLQDIVSIRSFPDLEKMSGDSMETSIAGCRGIETTNQGYVS